MKRALLVFALLAAGAQGGVVPAFNTAAGDSLAKNAMLVKDAVSDKSRFRPGSARTASPARKARG